MKLCPKCCVSLDATHYSVDRSRSDGRDGICKACRKIMRALQPPPRARTAAQKANIALIGAAWRLANAERTRDTMRKRRLEKRAMCLVAAARARARKKGLAFDLDKHIADLQRRIDVGFCELSGVAFNLEGGRTFDSPSFDRIVPTEGYTFNNVRVVCHALNVALGDWGEPTLLVVMRAYLAVRQAP